MLKSIISQTGNKSYKSLFQYDFSGYSNILRCTCTSPPDVKVQKIWHDIDMVTLEVLPLKFPPETFHTGFMTFCLNTVNYDIA